MPYQEILILAMTKMLSGICAAGVTRDPDPVTGLRWVRPVREFGSLLPGDMMDDEEDHLLCCGDVVALKLLRPRPDPPHVEDWVTDFDRHRPACVRCLQGQKRRDFFPKYLDRAPEDVLIKHTRSLCLLQPERVEARFSLDSYSGKYQTRLRFTLPGEVNHPQATSQRGVPVTDLKWRALGRSWLGERGGVLNLDHEVLLTRLNAEAVYLTVGLSRPWKGKHWPLVHAVHVVPDYQVEVDVAHL